MNWTILILSLLLSSIQWYGDFQIHLLVFLNQILKNFHYSDIWVSKSNCSDETGDGTQNNPYCTMAKAISMANNGKIEFSFN